MAALTALLTGVAAAESMPHASPALLRNLGQAGVGILIAYSVAVAGAEKVLSGKSTHRDHRDWLGFVSGLGLSGLIGAGLAFGIAQHRVAGHANFIDYIGLWWAVCSIGMLGLLVALLPLASYEWRKKPTRGRWRTERLKASARGN